MVKGSDVAKTVRFAPIFKGRRTKELVISGTPRPQGKIDLVGLLNDIDKQTQRIEEHQHYNPKKLKPRKKH